MTNLLWHERLSSPLARHYAGSAVLLLLVIGLAVRFSMDWSAANDNSSRVLAGKQVEFKALDSETAPLRGFDKYVEDSRAQLQAFYSRRIPPSYSVIATRIGELQVKSGVRLSRVQYTQGPRGSNLTEISMDAGISGAYPAIMHFVNDIERDQSFFIIRAMSLSGEQGGQVSLRIRISTWLRPRDAAASGLPATPEGGDAAVASSTQRKEGE
jgi:hypothetical protein